MHRRRPTTLALTLLLSLGAALLGAASVALPGAAICCARPSTLGAPCESLAPTTCCEATSALPKVESGVSLSTFFGPGTLLYPGASILAHPWFESSLVPHERLALSTVVLRL